MCSYIYNNDPLFAMRHALFFYWITVTTSPFVLCVIRNLHFASPLYLYMNLQGVLQRRVEYRRGHMSCIAWVDGFYDEAFDERYKCSRWNNITLMAYYERRRTLALSLVFVIARWGFLIQIPAVGRLKEWVSIAVWLPSKAVRSSPVCALHGLAPVQATDVLHFHGDTVGEGVDVSTDSQ